MRGFRLPAAGSRRRPAPPVWLIALGCLWLPVAEAAEPLALRGIMKGKANVR